MQYLKSFKIFESESGSNDSDHKFLPIYGSKDRNVMTVEVQYEYIREEVKKESLEYYVEKFKELGIPLYDKNAHLRQAKQIEMLRDTRNYHEILCWRLLDQLGNGIHRDFQDYPTKENRNKYWMKDGWLAWELKQPNTSYIEKQRAEIKAVFILNSDFKNFVEKNYIQQPNDLKSVLDFMGKLFTDSKDGQIYKNPYKK